MRKLYYLILLVWGMSAIGSCKKISSQEDINKINQLETEVNAIRSSPRIMDKNLDLTPFTALAEAYLAFADNFPDAPESPDFLFKAGELYSQELTDPKKAISLFSRVFEKYPDSKPAAQSLFLKGYLYNNVLKDLVNAEKAYHQFLESYPNHELAKSATFELDVLGKSEEEILQDLQKKQNLNAGGDSTLLQ